MIEFFGIRASPVIGMPASPAGHRLDEAHSSAGEQRILDGQIDLVLVVNTCHHIENRELYFRKLLADLASGGRVAVIEPDAELTCILRLFVEDGHGSRASDVEREMREAGYRRLESIDLLPVQIFEIFGSAPRATEPCSNRAANEPAEADGRAAPSNGSAELVRLPRGASRVVGSM